MAPPVHNTDGDERSLREVVTKILFQLEQMHIDMKKRDDVLEHLMAWKTGGDDPSKGMMVRMDRIERAHKSVGTVAWSAITGAAGALGIWIWTQIVGKNHS